MKDELQAEYKGGNSFFLSREQWKGRKAQISACDELLEEVKKYCWTLRGSEEHPYLSTKSNGQTIYLHAFVYRWLYGEEQFAEMIKDMVIDHLDNDGLNCSFENLCLSTDMENVIKGRGIDNGAKLKKVPDYIIDVFYLHDQHIHQMQISFNRAKLFYQGRQITRMFLPYNNRGTMLSDWYYLRNCLVDEIEPDYSSLRANLLAFELAEEIPDIPDDWYVFEKDGNVYARINADAGNHAISIVKAKLKRIRWDIVEENMRKAKEKRAEDAAPDTSLTEQGTESTE